MPVTEGDKAGNGQAGGHRFEPDILHERYEKIMDIIENYTAHYVKTKSGYMAQLVEWPDVVTEGKDIEDARDSLRDAIREMILAYKEKGWEIPKGSALFEVLPVAVG